MRDSREACSSRRTPRTGLTRTAPPRSPERRAHPPLRGCGHGEGWGWDAGMPRARGSLTVGSRRAVDRGRTRLGVAARPVVQGRVRPDRAAAPEQRRLPIARDQHALAAERVREVRVAVSRERGAVGLERGALVGGPAVRPDVLAVARQPQLQTDAAAARREHAVQPELAAVKEALAATRRVRLVPAASDRGVGVVRSPVEGGRVGHLQPRRRPVGFGAPQHLEAAVGHCRRSLVATPSSLGITPGLFQLRPSWVNKLQRPRATAAG